MKFHVGLPLRQLVSHLLGQKNTEKSSTQGKAEEPIFQDVDILYNFVFDIGGYLNPTEAARKILKQDFSLAAANYATGDTEMALHFKSALKLRQQAQQVADLSVILQKQKRKETLNWLLRHPRWFIHVLLVFFNKRNGNKGSIRDTDAVKLYETSQESIKTIDQAIASFQVFAGLHRYCEESLFTPFYLREVPFVRLELQPCSATIAAQNRDIDVWLLIHRTGVAILTFSIRFDGSFSVDDLNRLQAAENILITESKIVKTLVDFQASVHNFPSFRSRKKHASKHAAGKVEWSQGKTSHGTSLCDVFQLYQDAIISTIIGKKPSKKRPISSWLRSPDWFQYPMIFIRQVMPACHEEQIFKEKYSQALAGIDLGTAGWREIPSQKVQEIVGRDFSLTSASSFYINEGHAIALYYGAFRERYIQQYGSDAVPETQWLYEYFQRTSIIEALLIQQWILHILDAQVSVLPFNVGKLSNIKRNLIIALYEYHNDIFQYATAQDILKEGYSIMGVDRTYENLLFKLESIEKLIETTKNGRQERRNVFLNLVIMLLTLVAGLPSANQIVTIFSSWKLLPFSSTIATLILYISLVVCVLLAILWNLWPSDKREKIVTFDQSRPAKTPTFVWPRKVKITALPKITKKKV
jgi:hypothetical protein